MGLCRNNVLMFNPHCLILFSTKIENFYERTFFGHPSNNYKFVA